MRKAIGKDIYAVRGSSTVQRIFLISAAGLCAVLAWWLLCGGGVVAAGKWMGRVWSPGDVARRLCLAVEYARYKWKRLPENSGRLYTLGLFRYSRHPNYLGDLISFSGPCLIAGRWITAIVPLVMLAGFVFANVPMLDAHLHDHYGPEFDEYAKRTCKLIPFVY